MGITPSKQEEFNRGVKELMKVVEDITEKHKQLSILNPDDDFDPPIEINDSVVRTIAYKYPYKTTLPSTVYTLTKLDEYDFTYSEISNKFKSSTRSYTISLIEKIDNPYLLALYNLKELELKARNGVVREILLYHGTSSCNVDSICRNNLDYRRCGSSVGTKFGQGVSFALDSYYATHYCKGDSNEKVMFVFKVLVTNQHVGDKLTVVPKIGYDTTTNFKDNVYVKYDDDVFYPLYKITFR